MDSSLRGPAEPARGDDVVVVRAGHSVRSVYAEDENEEEAVRDVNDVRQGEHGPSRDVRGVHMSDRVPPGGAPREAGAGRARPRGERAAAPQAPAGARRQPGAPERGGRIGRLGGAPAAALDGAGAPASPAGAAPAVQAGRRPGGASGASSAWVAPQPPEDGSPAAVPAGAGPAAGPAAAAPSVKALRDARARDAARRPMLPYDDSDYDEEEGPGRRGAAGAVAPAAGAVAPGARRGGVRGVEAGAGGRDGGGERAPVAASGGGGGGEFEAAAGPDVRSAAELTALDTIRHAEEEYPKWEEELFGSPAGARPAHPATRARPPTGCLAALKFFGFLLNCAGQRPRQTGRLALPPALYCAPGADAPHRHLSCFCMSPET